MTTEYIRLDELANMSEEEWDRIRATLNDGSTTSVAFIQTCRSRDGQCVCEGKDWQSGTVLLD